jgi:hypothetical protein
VARRHDHVVLAAARRVGADRAHRDVLGGGFGFQRACAARTHALGITW